MDYLRVLFSYPYQSAKQIWPWLIARFYLQGNGGALVVNELAF